MTQRTYEDPILELATRLGDPLSTIELAGEVSPEDAEIVLSVLDEVEAEERAAGILATWRRQGLVL
jgi:hypothetical protein